MNSCEITMLANRIMQDYLDFTEKDSSAKRNVSINDYVCIRNQAINEINNGVSIGKDELVSPVSSHDEPLESRTDYVSKGSPPEHRPAQAEEKRSTSRPGNNNAQPLSLQEEAVQILNSLPD